MAIELLKDLLRIPSYSGQEKQVLTFINQYFTDHNVESFFQNNNLVVHFKGKNPTRAFIFNSHVDVVDTGDESRWKHKPWEAEVDESRIYGRGASDMKSGVYASMEFATSLAKEQSQPPTDLWFTYVVNEEVDGSGTQDFADWFKTNGYLDQYKEMTAIFTEPTNLREAEYGHRGNFFLKALVDGDSAHSSRPKEIKKHTILLMTKFINAVVSRTTDWEKKYESEEFAPPTITPTSIQAKSASPNKTSDHCEATFDLRTIPGFHEEAFGEIGEIAKKNGISLEFLYPPAPTGYTSPDAKIFQVMHQLIPDLKLTVSKGSADLGFLTSLGIEGAIFGPGEKEQAHAIDESANINQILSTPELYKKIYNAWAEKE